MKPEDQRKNRWIITGDSLCGLSEKTAKKITSLLKKEGLNVDCVTEYYYCDVCGFKGRVSTDLHPIMLSDKRKKILGIDEV